MKLKRCKLVNVPVNLIDMNDIQPSGRTALSALKYINSIVGKTKLIVPPALVALANGRYKPIDGHRRIAVAIQNNITTIQCNVYAEADVDPVEGFGYHASSLRSPRGNEYLESWSRGVAINKDVLYTFPKNQSQSIRQIIDWIGVAETQNMVNSGMAPNVASLVNKILAIQVQFLNANEGVNVTGGDVLRWLHTHSGQLAVNQFIKTDLYRSKNPAAAARKLFRAIRRDRPIYKPHAATIAAAKQARATL